MNRSITVHEVLRYTKLNAVDRLVHPYRNYWTVQRNPADPGARSLQLEAGINAPGSVTTPDGDRLPVLLLRSSPSKVGTMTTPWEDQYRLDEGRITYHGDHKVMSRVALGETPGNRRLLDVWAQHRSTSVVMRASAPPILVFRTATVQTPYGSRSKGFVEFCGLVVIDDLYEIEAIDPTTGRPFPNYAAELAVISLGDRDSFDWRWIDARRTPSLLTADTFEHAPSAWFEWIVRGRTGLPRIRRYEQRDR